MQTANLLMYRSDLGLPTGQMLQNAAKYDYNYLYTGREVMPDPINLTGVPDYTLYRNYGNTLRALRPGTKVGPYFVGIAYSHIMEPWLYALTHDDMLHLPLPDGRPLIGPLQGLVHFMPNLTSKRVRRKIIDAIIDFMLKNRFDILMIDGYNSPWFYVDMAAKFGAMNGCLEGPVHTTDYWMAVIPLMGKELSWSMADRGLEVIGVGVAPSDLSALPVVEQTFAGPDHTNMANYAGASIFEFEHKAYGDPDYYAHMMNMVKLLTDKKSPVMIACQPWFDATQNAWEPSLLDFYAATTGLLNEPPYTRCMYSPYEPYRAWTPAPVSVTSVYWDDRWDMLPKLGTPKAPALRGTTPFQGYPGFPYDTWSRRFSGGLVIVNPSRVYQGYQDKDPKAYHMGSPTGPILDMRNAAPHYLMNIPPLAGWMLFDA